MIDVLQEALRELKIGEELIVTAETLRRIRDRIKRFRDENRMKRFVIRPESGLQRIQRKE